MSPTITAATLPKFFFTIPEFKAIGGPGRTKVYELAGVGLLDLVKDPAGRVGVTAEEVRRYFARSQPIGENKRDLRKATAASIEARKAAA